MNGFGLAHMKITTNWSAKLGFARCAINRRYLRNRGAVGDHGCHHQESAECRAGAMSLTAELRRVDAVRFNDRFAIPGILFLALSVWLTSCERRDSKLAQQVVGTWTKEDGEMSFGANGTFHSQWRASSNRSVDYFGTWKLNNGNLLCATTNVASHGLEAKPLTGAVDTFKIVQLDASRLLLDIGSGQTNELIRK